MSTRERFEVTDRMSAYARLARAAALVPAFGLLVACGGTDSVLDPAAQGTTIVVGSANSVPSEVVAHIYAGALARTGATVRTQPRIGDRAEYLAALDEGGITLVPEISGDLLDYLNPDATQSTPDEVFDVLNRSLPDGLSVSDYAAAQDRPAFLMTQPRATQLSARSLSDIGAACSTLTLAAAAAPEQSVVDALQAEYGCRFSETRVLPSADLRTALETGDADVAVVRGSAATGSDDDLVTLVDEKFVYPAQNVLPLYRTGALTDAQRMKLNIVAGELNTADLADLVRQIDDADARPADVARSWLDAHGL
jgi:osmoprotectant transport system substrate-binding protein